VITAKQLLEAGLTRQGIQRRVSNGLLHRVYRGVYRVGHRPPSTEASYLAAVLACGEEAALSGYPAAFVHGLLRGVPPAPEISTTADRRPKGVIVHRLRHLDRLDVSVFRGIPITTLPRTIVDLAATHNLDDLARICHEAAVRYRLAPRMAYASLARRPNTPGAEKLHRILRGDVDLTLSELERSFLVLLRSAGLPLPETNRQAGGRYVDCRWPAHRLTVELDSYTYHHTRHAWEQDRRREREARARGDEFRRYTYGDVTDEPGVVVAELRPLLAAQDAKTASLT
jgi:hypothetical protein